jgi:hypothetical protein
MRTPSFRRTTAVLLLLLAAVLAAPPAFAAGRPAEGVSLAPLEILWSFLRAAWSKEGCKIDPNGHCKPGTASPPPAQTKDGCHLDPNGSCKP